MNLSGPFIRRPIGTALLAIGLFMVGLICYLRLGVSALPNIEIPVIFVHASQSGADAATMASTVTAPLERHLGQLPGIDRMRSSSSEGSSLVFMIFQSGHNIDSAALDVQTAINSAQADLPSGMGSPMYQKANPNDDPVIAIALTSQTQSADELQRGRLAAGAAHPPDQRRRLGRHRWRVDACGARGCQPAPDERVGPDRR